MNSHRNFSATYSMRSIDDLDNISDLYRVLLKVKGLRVPVFALLLQCLWLGFYQFSTHGQNLETFLFQPHNDTHCLSTRKIIFVLFESQ